MGRAILHPVLLDPAQRNQLRAIARSGRHRARIITRARILLLADQGPNGPARSDAQICASLSVCQRTLSRVRSDFARLGMKAIEHQNPRRYRPRRLDGAAEARLSALACSAPPQGQARWTLRLLADALVSLDVADEISHETVRATLKKTNLSLG
jgi:hypothetical protein